MTLTCWSCRHSTDTGVSLAPFCDLYDELVFAKCDAFEYEPGTDTDERVQVRPAGVAVRPVEPLLHGADAARDASLGGSVPADAAQVRRERGVQG